MKSQWTEKREHELAKAVLFWVKENVVKVLIQSNALAYTA